MTKRIAFQKLKKYQRAICIVLLWATVDSVRLGLVGTFFLFGIPLFFYWDYITTPPEIRKQNAAAKFKRVPFEKLKKYQRAICIFLLFMTVANFAHDHVEIGLTYGFVLFFYFSIATTPLEIRRQIVAARFRRGSNSLDPSNPCGFNNSASPLYHQHNSKSMFDK